MPSRAWPWPFEDPPETPVVTTTQVTQHGMPILYVSHELDEDGEPTWQFHCVVVPFKMEDAQLVRLDTVVALDASVVPLCDLPVGYAAKRSAIGAPWSRFKE